MTRLGMAIDMTRCTGCQTCVVACQLANALRPGVSWAKVDAFEWGRWPEAGRAYMPHACLHCDEPICVRVCPTGASMQHDDGAVVIEYDLCIGCGVCVTACVYGARVINRNDSWAFGAVRPAPYEIGSEDRVGVAEKCTLCRDRTMKGEKPACVEACINGIRIFGDLDDSESEINEFIEQISACQVDGTAMYYATGTHDIDPYDAIVSANRGTSGNGAEEPVTENGGGNPAVVVAAGAAAAVSAIGIGIAAKRNGDKRKSTKD